MTKLDCELFPVVATLLLSCCCPTLKFYFFFFYKNNIMCPLTVMQCIESRGPKETDDHSIAAAFQNNIINFNYWISSSIETYSQILNIRWQRDGPCGPHSSSLIALYTAQSDMISIATAINKSQSRLLSDRSDSCQNDSRNNGADRSLNSSLVGRWIIAGDEEGPQCLLEAVWRCSTDPRRNLARRTGSWREMWFSKRCAILAHQHGFIINLSFY